MKFYLIFFFLFLLQLSTLSFANLMAVDLGLNYIKVAIARPGKGLELVVNEQAKRKTPAAVAFTEESERLFGDAAVAYSAKSPNRAILNGRDILGICDPSTESSPFCKRAKHSIPGLPDLTGEEIIAMQLSMARKQASVALSGAPVKDVAVTVPAWFDERQRLAVFDAASIIGLNCLGVVNSNTAAAIKYALDGKAKPTKETIAAEKAKDKKKRTPKSITQRVLFYDVGASSATASIAEIVSDPKTSIATNVRMIAHESDAEIGGKYLDQAVVNRLADAFDKQRTGDFTPAQQLPRVIMRLQKEARRVKEVLSANTETVVSIASLHDDIDLRTSLTRADLESDASDMLSRISYAPKRVLQKAGLKSKDLDAVVPFGGASRMPKIQDELCNALGIKTLNKSINTDEAAVMGSVFYAASLSSTFRVRKLDFEDTYTRTISAEIEKDSSNGLFSGKGKGTQNIQIFAEGASKMPSKKTLSLNRNGDFGIKVFLDLDKSGSVRFPEKTLLSSIKVKGVADVLKKVKDSSKSKNLTPRVAITFHIDKSGILRVGTAESSVDEKIVVEREVEIKEKETKKGEKKDSKANDDKKDDNSTEKKSEDTSDEKTDDTAKTNAETSDEKTKSETNGKNDKKKKKKTRIEKSTQTIVHRHPLTIEFVQGEGVIGMQMSGQELQDAKKVLKDLEKADLDRAERADALNALEGFILEIRSKVRGAEEDDDLYKVTTEEEREKLASTFDEAEDWMYTDEAKQTSNLRKKHFELQKLYEPMESRAKELEQRAKSFKLLLQATETSIKHGKELRATHVERKSDKVEKFDKFLTYCETVMTWITDKETEQEKTPLTETPKVTVKDIMNKATELRTELEIVFKLPLPSAPEPKADKKKEDESKKENDPSTSNSTSNEGDMGNDAFKNAKEKSADFDAEAAKAGTASGAGVKEEL